MSHFRSFSMTILLLLVTISPFAFAVDNQPNEVGPQEHELESEWNVIEHESVIASSLKPSSGIIHLEAGSFDPTYSQYPFFSPSLNVNDDYQTTGFAIIQLHERNGLILDHLSEKYDFDVLEHLSEESWIIRLSEHNKEISHFEDSAIRWIGPFTPDARISIELSMSTLVEGTSIDLIPSPDLSEAGLNSIVVDLLNNGADMAWCGYTQCQFTVGFWIVKKF